MTKKQIQEMAAWCYQFVSIHNGPEEAMDNLSAIANGGKNPRKWHEWPYIPAPVISSEGDSQRHISNDHGDVPHVGRGPVL